MIDRRRGGFRQCILFLAMVAGLCVVFSFEYFFCKYDFLEEGNSLFVRAGQADKIQYGRHRVFHWRTGEMQVSRRSASLFRGLVDVSSKLQVNWRYGPTGRESFFDYVDRDTNQVRSSHRFTSDSYLDLQNNCIVVSAYQPTGVSETVDRLVFDEDGPRVEQIALPPLPTIVSGITKSEVIHIDGSVWLRLLFRPRPKQPSPAWLIEDCAVAELMSLDEHSMQSVASWPIYPTLRFTGLWDSNSILSITPDGRSIETRDLSGAILRSETIPWPENKDPLVSTKYSLRFSNSGYFCFDDNTRRIQFDYYDAATMQKLYTGPETPALFHYDRKSRRALLGLGYKKLLVTQTDSNPAVQEVLLPFAAQTEVNDEIAVALSVFEPLRFCVLDLKSGRLQEFRLLWKAQLWSVLFLASVCCWILAFGYFYRNASTWLAWSVLGTFALGIAVFKAILVCTYLNDLEPQFWLAAIGFWIWGSSFFLVFGSRPLAWRLSCHIVVLTVSLWIAILWAKDVRPDSPFATILYMSLVFPIATILWMMLYRIFFFYMLASVAIKQHSDASRKTSIRDLACLVTASALLSTTARYVPWQSFSLVNGFVDEGLLLLTFGFLLHTLCAIALFPYASNTTNRIVLACMVIGVMLATGLYYGTVPSLFRRSGTMTDFSLVLAWIGLSILISRGWRMQLRRRIRKYEAHPPQNTEAIMET